MPYQGLLNTSSARCAAACLCSKHARFTSVSRAQMLSESPRSSITATSCGQTGFSLIDLQKQAQLIDTEACVLQLRMMTGEVCDTYCLTDDFVHLHHNAGVHVHKDLLLILAVSALNTRHKPTPSAQNPDLLLLR